MLCCGDLFSLLDYSFSLLNQPRPSFFFPLWLASSPSFVSIFFPFYLWLANIALACSWTFRFLILKSHPRRVVSGLAIPGPLYPWSLYLRRHPKHDRASWTGLFRDPFSGSHTMLSLCACCRNIYLHAFWRQLFLVLYNFSALHSAHGPRHDRFEFDPCFLCTHLDTKGCFAMNL